jgi:hypothetical protein
MVGDTASKPETSSVHRKDEEKDVERLLKKEFFLIYNAYAAFANACEETFKQKPSSRAATRGIKKVALKPIRMRKFRAEKHLHRAIISSESWNERDKLYRRLAAQCYENAQLLKASGDLKQAAKWMNLTLRYLRLSLDPKAQEDITEMMRQLAEIKARMKEQEEKQGEKAVESDQN